MGKQKNIFLLNNQKGQSAVEYILLLAVVSFLGFTVMKSDKFKEFFGKDSKFFEVIANQMQYSYRHGRLGSRSQIKNDKYDYSSEHDTYKISEKGTSRFFINLNKYPGN